MEKLSLLGDIDHLLELQQSYLTNMMNTNKQYEREFWAKEFQRIKDIFDKEVAELIDFQIHNNAIVEL